MIKEASALVLAVWSSSLPLLGDVVHETPGAVEEGKNGWTFIPSKNPRGEVFTKAEGWYPDKGGRLLGPVLKIPDTDPNFYRLSFETLAVESGHWGIFFNDAEGNQIVSDVYSSIYGDTEKTRYEQIVYRREGAVALRPFFQSLSRVNIQDVRVERVPDELAAKWCDELYKGLPPLEFVAPPSRMKYLPRTVQALKNGHPLRVVLLGDSIVNDIFNSNFQALLQRQYPNANLTFVCSVLGSTGCWFYQEPENFQRHVRDLRPDLVMIGGISHRNDLEAIRKTLEMARDTAEVVLMSGPWLQKQAGKIDPFAEEQKKLAAEMGVEFIDFATIWNAYLKSSSKSQDWFFRDPVHANDRGKQILARILERCFGVPKPLKCDGS